jgi:hypothetical protein
MGAWQLTERHLRRASGVSNFLASWRPALDLDEKKAAGDEPGSLFSDAAVPRAVYLAMQVA